MVLTLRTVKGSALTHLELDNNFTSLQSGINNSLPLSGGELTGPLSACSNVYLSEVYACGGELNIYGNVTIHGSATTLNTEIVQSKDNAIHLNYSGTNVTAEGGGIIVEDGQSDGLDSSILTNSFGAWVVTPGFWDLNASGTTNINGDLILNGNILQITSGQTGFTQVISSPYEEGDTDGGIVPLLGGNTNSGVYSTIIGGVNNIISSGVTGSTVFGYDNIINHNNVMVFGSNITTTQDGTLFTENIIIKSGNTFTYPTGFSEGYVLTSDSGGTATWEELPPSVTSFSALTDTNINSVTDGQLVIYSGETLINVNKNTIVDDVTIGVNNDLLEVKDNSITEPKLNTTNLATDGYVLSYDNATSGFTWVDVDAQDTFTTGTTNSVLATNNSNSQSLNLIGNAGFSPITLSFTDTFVTGGTHSNGTITFTQNDGGTYQVTGLDSTDTFSTGATISNGTLQITGNEGFTTISGTGVVIQSVTGEQGLTATTTNGAVTVGIQPFSVTNDMLENNTITINDGLALSANTNTVSLGGSIDLLVKVDGTTIDVNGSDELQIKDFTLSALTDVNYSESLSDNQIIQYNQSSSKWENTTTPSWFDSITHNYLGVWDSGTTKFNDSSIYQDNTNNVFVTNTTTFINENDQNVVTIIGSGSTNPLFSIQGSQGELFSVTDSLIGSLFSVNDISGLPIFEVFSDNNIIMGSYESPSLNTTSKVITSIGSNDIHSISKDDYTSAYYDYNISDGTNLRAGNVIAVWSGSTVNYTEVSTSDIGDTTPVALSVNIVGSDAVLRASVSTGGTGTWVVKTIVRGL